MKLRKKLDNMEVSGDDQNVTKWSRSVAVQDNENILIWNIENNLKKTIDNKYHKPTSDEWEHAKHT